MWQLVAHRFVVPPASGGGLRALPGSVTLAPMIQPGSPSPEFTLADQFGRKISSSDYKGSKHMLLLFYPLDFTNT